MCGQRDTCAFYVRYKDTKDSLVRSLIAHYCDQPGGNRFCRRRLIDEYYDVRLNPAVGPAGDFLAYR